MNDHNTERADSTARDDLKHTDTIATGEQEIQPAGYEQSISPLGEVPPAGERAELPSDDTASIADRTGRDPSNLGDDIPDQGDLIHPSPANAPIGKAPGI